jgi:hypothetical protein
MTLHDDSQIAEFAHRYEQIQVHRASTDDLMKVWLHSIDLAACASLSLMLGCV